MKKRSGNAKRKSSAKKPAKRNNSNVAILKSKRPKKPRKIKPDHDHNGHYS